MKFLVNQQEIIRTDSSRIIAGSEHFVEAQFDFDEDWNELTITACFKNGDERRAVTGVRSGEPIFVPWEVLKPGNMYIYLEGYNGNVRITSAKMKKPVVVAKSGAFRCTEISKAPPSSVYDTLLHAYSLAQKSVDLLIQRANAGEFNGKGLEFTWDGSRLGVKKQGENEYAFVELKGATGEVSLEELNAQIEDAKSLTNLLNFETNTRIDAEFGNISSALDEIIALQNSLIGGEA